MIQRVILYLFFVIFCGGSIVAQNNKDVDTSSDFLNVELFDKLFKDLSQLEKGKNFKINIVHIGDSHIQADLFTDIIRQALQQKFGNAGYGFSFPYQLAKTNGTRYIKYTSNISWVSRRNIYPISDATIGLSGIGLYTDSTDFYIQLDVSNQYRFNTIKLIHPFNSPFLGLSLSDAIVAETKTTPAAKKENSALFHKVKRGQTLYSVSRIYGITLSDLKKNNKLKSDKLKVGQTLLIRQKYTKEFAPKVETSVKPIIQDTLPLINEPYISTYSSTDPLSKIKILPSSPNILYNLNGVILENDSAGVIYHSIGVNGAKASDFNKYPLFYEQLMLLKPNMVVISLGTNESFGKYSVAEYMFQLGKMIKNIRERNKDVLIVVMTSPPSLFKRKTPNTLIEDYSKELLKLNNCVVWNLLSKMGGSSAPKENEGASLMARDKVHYTKEGYEYQGEMFSSDFLKAYSNYIKKTTGN